MRGGALLQPRPDSPDPSSCVWPRGCSLPPVGYWASQMASTSHRSWCHGSPKRILGRQWIWCRGAPIPFNPSALQINPQVRLHRFLHPNDNLSLHIDVPGTTGLDLSKVKRLQDVVFHCGRPNVKWIGKVLRTAEPRILRHVLLELPRHLGTGDAIWEPVRQEWLELDCLLVQFWTSHSLRSTVMYGPGEGGKDLRDLVARLLPELTRGGILTWSRTGPH